jgi:hypothetical protein
MVTKDYNELISSNRDITLSFFFPKVQNQIAGHARTLDAEASIEEGVSPSRTEASSSEVAGPSLSSLEESKFLEKEASEIREQSMVGHVEAHGGSVSHADPSVCDISSQPSTGSSTNGKSD